MNDILNAIDERQRAYNMYAAPQVNPWAYVNAVANAPTGTRPSGYGVDDHFSNAYYTWNRNKNETEMNDALGAFMRLQQDEMTLQDLREYLQATANVNSIEDPEANSETIEKFGEAYHTVANGRMNDTKLNSKLNALIANKQYDKAIAEIDRQLAYSPEGEEWEDPNTIQARKAARLFEAQVAKEQADKSDAKIDPYFKYKEETTDMDFFDIDTYLYKLPGLLGSSAATLTANIATTAGAWASGAIGGSVGGPVGSFVGGAGGAVISIAGNLYSREHESNAEVYDYYRQAVQKQLEKDGIYRRTLTDAKAQMRDLGIYTEEQINDDQYVLDQVLTNRIVLHDNQLDKAKIDNMQGMRELYLDNMALSASDIVQTALAVAPIKFGRITGNLTKQLSDRTNRVLAYGLDKVDELSTLTRRKAILDLGGRMAVSSVMEGMEEGTQYLKGQAFLNRDFDPDANIVDRWLSNQAAGIRSAFAALTPWDPLYSDDKELMENFKGGMLLGGIMTGMYGAIPSIHNAVKQEQANRIVQQLYAENEAIRDRVRKNEIYSAAASNNQTDRINQAFDYLEAMNIDGIDKQSIDEEREFANTMRNLTNSAQIKEQAESLGIDPRSREYNTFTALKYYYNETAVKAAKQAVDAYNEVESLLHSDKANAYISQLTKNLTDKGAQITEEQVRNAIRLNELDRVYSQLVKDGKVDGQKLEDMSKNINMSTNATDTYTNASMIEKELASITELKKNSLLSDAWFQANGVSKNQLQIPEIQDDLAKAIEKNVLAKVNADRAQAEIDLWNSKDRGKEIRKRIEEYNDVSRRNRNLVSDLDDLDAGRDLRRAEEDNTVIEPESVDSNAPQSEPANTSTEGPTTTEPEPEPTAAPVPPAPPASPAPAAAETTTEPQGDTVGGSPVALSYLLEGGKGTITSTGYFLHGVAAAFPEVTQQIESIRSKYLQELEANPDVYSNSNHKSIQEIREVIQNRYGQEGVDIFADLLKNSSGYNYKDGQVIQRRIDDLKPIQQESSELTETREKVNKSRADVAEFEDKKLKLKKGTKAREIYDKASQVIQDEFISRHPNVTQYEEYVATNELENLSGQRYDKLHDIVYYRDQMEEEIFNNGNTKRANGLSGYLSRLINEYQEIVASEQKAAEQAKEKEQAKTTSNDKQNEAEPVPPVKSEATRPAQVTDVPDLAALMGDWLGEDAANALGGTAQPVNQPQQAQPEAQPATEQPTQTEPIIPELPELTYDKRNDPYSHEMNYRLKNPDRSSKRFQGMEEYLNDVDLADVVTNPDFLSETHDGMEIVVRPYLNPRTNKYEDAVYLILPYKGKNYITALSTVEGMQRYLNVLPPEQRMRYDQQQIVLNNLKALREKTIQLYRATENNPNLKVVPTVVRTTTGRFVNEVNQDGSPKNRKLTESKHLTVKDPYEITPDNTFVGISTGNRGNATIRLRNRTISARGRALGQPMWVIPITRRDGSTDNLIAKLNYATFKDSPKVAKLIVDLLLDNSNSYVDANGVNTGVNPQSLLMFLVNFGSHTAVNPNDFRLTPDQISRLQDKQFYLDEHNNLILGKKTYPIGQIISDPSTRAEVEQYITDNFHWAIDEDGLNKNYLGGSLQSQVRDQRFGPMEAMLRTSNVDKVVLIPGELEFNLKDFGIVKDANGRKSIDENHPNGISVLGWYIKQGILLTDISDTLKDANIYIDDVRVVDKRTEPNIKQALEEIKETAESSNIMELPDIDGTTRVVDINATMALLDGKKKKGPNMEVVEDYIEGLMVNDENRMSPKQATKWLEDKLGITPEITQSVIDVTEAGNAVVGRVTEDSILLSELAPEGTEYHEAWHRVSQLLISDKARKKIYDRYRRKHNSNLTDTQLDEIFAEDFREFQLNEAQNYDFDTKNWFRRIIDFIKLWARTGSYALANIYSNINRAKYNGVQPSQENVSRFRQIYSGEGPNLEVMGYQFKNIATVKQLDDITKSLTYAFFRVSATDGHVINYSDLRTEKPRFDTLKLILEAQNYKQPSPVMQELIDKFDDVIAPMIANNLKNLGIRAIDQNENDTISNMEEGAEGVNIGQHTIEGMNVSIKDNAPAEVKFFFNTIPAYEIGTDGRPRVKIDPLTHFPSFVDSNKSWVNVLKDLSGCRTIGNMYAKVAQLAKQGDPYYQALLLKLDTEINVRSQSQDERVRMDSEALLTKIETVVTSDVNNFITVKISRDRDTKQVSMNLVDNGVDIKALNYPGVWSLSMFNNSGLFKTTEGGQVVSTSKAKERLNLVINNLNKLKEAFLRRKGLFDDKGKDYDLHAESNLLIAKDFIISNLNSVGIGIDRASLNKMLASGDFGAATSSNYDVLNDFVTGNAAYGSLTRIIEQLEAINKSIDSQGNLAQIKDKEGNTINPRFVWNNLGIIKYMAQYYAQAHATDRSLSSLGPDNSSYYQVSQNNFAKDRLNEIVNDEEVQQQLSGVVYNQHSILLDAAKRGNKDIAIETFINFKDTTSQDTGRDYFSITDREDYLAKLVAVLNNRLIFPTVADKKTYHFIRGLMLPHDPIRLYGNSASFFTQYGDQALDILLGYCYDELNQIELCLRQIDDNPDHVKIIDGKEVHVNEDGTINNDWLEPTRRIKNFHTPNSVKWEDDKGNKHERTLEGNGARFLFLTGIYTQETDAKGNKVKKFINFNDPMKSAQENLQNAKDYFFSKSVETQKAFLSAIINARVRQEIQTAKNMGLISINDNNDIWSMRNILLDSKIIEDRRQRYTQFDPTNAEAFAILDVLSDYTINSIISISEVEKLFSGSPAYYKVKYDKDGLVDVSIDKIKRLGSLTSTGINNRLDFFNDPLESDEYTVAELKDHEIKDKQYAQLEELFTRSNIKETIQEYNGQAAWDAVKNLSVKEIEEKYPEEVKMARAAAKKDVAGYKKEINVADAAVYISPKMAENLLRMRGVWSYDIKRAFDVLTNPETADKWESDPKLYAQANKVVLNAMKYVAFGTRFDEIPGLGIPYFNKMALFPLFKSIATGDIRKLYDRMTEPGREIDMVMFNSAVKAGSRNPVKPYRQAKDSEIELKDGQTILTAELTEQLSDDQAFRPNDYDKLVTYKQPYKYIRQQLETNPHAHEEQMLGTQFMKVSLSNLRDDDVYGVEGDQITGAEIKSIIMSSLNKLSDMGVDGIREQVYTNGEVDTAKLAKMLSNDARDSDANDNVLSGLRVDENGDLIMPLDALSDNKWLESRFISMMNKEVVDVHMPGGAFIQRSAFGMEATAQDVITEDMINDGKPLLMINEKDGSMDSVVSINLFKHIIPDYNKMTFKQARQWLLDHNIIGQNAKANAIGYRIPTQSIASISALRFVDVFPEIMGDTIMLPEGFTKLTGSDFDIDKLYVARYGYDQEGNLVTDDSAAGLKNRMLRQYLRVLLTKDNTGSLKLSIDNATDNVKSILKDIEGPGAFRPEPFEVYSPTYQEARKAEYTGGKAGIGPFALNNAHHILTQLTKLHMVSNDFTEAMGITDVSRIFDVPTEHNPRGGRILDWLSAMINAFVDIAKDPYIVRLNVNGWTYNMVSFLLRTGKGKDTFYFMYQPILREMAQEVLKTKGKYSVDRTKTPSQLENEAIERVLDKYDPNKSRRKKYAQINKDLKLAAQTYSELFMEQELNINNVPEYTTLLRQAIKDPMEISDFNDFQVRVYYAWKMLKPYADSLANLVKYSKIDTKKTGKTFAEQLNYYDGMQRLLDDPNFEPGAIRRFYDETFVGHKTDNAILFGSSILSNKLLRNTELFGNQKDAVLCLLGRKGLADASLLKSIISGMEAQIKSRFFNQYVKDNDIDITKMFKGRTSMAKRLNNFKELIRRRDPRMSHLIDNNGNLTNDFLEFLIPNIQNTDDNPDGLDFIDTSELLNVEQAKANNLINYWRELIEDPNPQISKLFKDLAIYAFIIGGDNPVMNGFFQYLPNSYRIAMGYRDYMRNVLDQYANNSTLGYADKDDFFRNNWTNDKLVKPVALYTKKGVLETIQYNSTIPNMIVGMRNGEVAINANNWIDVQVTRPNGKVFTEAYPIFPPYIKYNDGFGSNPNNWHLYTLVGYGTNEQGRYYPVYGLIGKKGYRHRGHTVTEYGVQTQFDFNRETEWNYTEAVNNPAQLASMSSNPGIQQSVKSITDLPSYQNYNYMQQDPQTVLEEDIEDGEAVLEEKEEPDTVTPRFAGIGTREITSDGINAIRSVFEKTFSTNIPTSVEQTHNETLEVLGGVTDPIANSEMKDAIEAAQQGITFESALSTVNPIFTQEEINQIKQGLNGRNLKVMSVSRYTDPAFFAKEIVRFLEENAKKPFTDPTRVNVIELWTKHDGEPIQEILQACKKYKVASMVSFSITTLGNTPLEQGVLEYKTLLDLIKKLIESGGLDPRTTTIRIDPLLPGYTNMDNVREVVNIGKSMGIRKYVTSLVQSYGYLDGTDNDRKVTSGINSALARVGQTYDWDKYYGRIPYGKNQGKINFKPKQEYIDEIGNVLLGINKDPEIELQTCSFTINGLKASACLDPLIIERVTGVSVTRSDGTYERDTSRPECMCYGCHGDKFRWNEKQCFSSCAYCYAAHSGDNNFQYYNNDGTLKNRPLTRVSGQFIGDTNQQTIQSMDDLVTTDWHVVDFMVKYDRAVKKITPILDQLELTSDQRNTYYKEFNDMLQEEHDNGNLNTQEDIDGVVNKFICNL